MHIFSYDSSFTAQNITLTSLEAFKFRDENYYTTKQNITILPQAKGHALSIFASYNFETLNLQLSLRDVLSQNLIAVGTLSYIEDVQSE